MSRRPEAAGMKKKRDRVAIAVVRVERLFQLVKIATNGCHDFIGVLVQRLLAQMGSKNDAKRHKNETCCLILRK